eukprot:CAMPEP_0198651786 /NCGR_PEP_ID=MMETSP1467-20131203/5929_1 /TAXON_ID=1462469 /ORGANISM="unid. sp., Strain CCMP2135" /LENGTH=195 /DNA_ID=CAMNT_0044387689 /DNA_START=330 /DNA_END=915 /DNA_ORIENTATION=+
MTTSRLVSSRLVSSEEECACRPLLFVSLERRTPPRQSPFSLELPVGGDAVGDVDLDAVVLLGEDKLGGEAGGVVEVFGVPVGVEELLLPGRLVGQGRAPGRRDLDVVVAEDRAFAVLRFGPVLAVHDRARAGHRNRADVDVVHLGDLRHGHADAARHHGPRPLVVNEHDLTVTSATVPSSRREPTVGAARDTSVR